MRQVRLRWDLGLRDLLPEWKKLFLLTHLKDDVLAGMTVACVAIPLSLAIALASGVEPGAGLITAIVAGIVCALFGGAELSVSGPAAAMSIIIAANVAKFGLGGLIVIGTLCGLLQLAFGIFGLGKLIRFVPTPVIAGFTAGIGVIILVGQMPRALGISPPEQGHLTSVLTHVASSLSDVRWPVLAITLFTFTIAKFLPRVAPKMPAPLVAVALASLITNIGQIDIPTIGTLPSSLPIPKLPELPQSGWGELMGNAFIVFAVASLETLLSCSSLDKFSKGKKHDPDQELIGQGMGNVVVAMFGGIPVTGVIARSALNVRAGAKTRRSAILHSLALLVVIFSLSGVISRIPIAALAGMLISVAVSMLQWKEFKLLWTTARSEGAVYLVTFSAIIFFDLIAGVQAGIVAALVVAVLRLGHLKIFCHIAETKAPSRFSLSGPVTFLSSRQMGELSKNVSKLELGRKLVVDLSRVTFLDSSGAELLIEFIEESKHKGHRVALKGLMPALRRVLDKVDQARVTDSLHVATEAEVAEVLDLAQDLDTVGRIDFGVAQFITHEREAYSPLLARLHKGQSPHTLFVTCSDSRIAPNLITSTDPGELFVVRNVGCVIPKCGADETPAEGAAVEYSIDFLGVREIIVCGHTQCGALGSTFHQEALAGVPNVKKWLAEVHALKDKHPECRTGDDLIRHHLAIQIQNLRSYPSVKNALETRQLRIRAWFYDVGTAEVWELDLNRSEFKRLGRQEARIAAVQANVDK